MELKCLRFNPAFFTCRLSIVPSWNWNPARSSRPEAITNGYQSYHRGIEMRYHSRKCGRSGLSIVPSWNWNSVRLISFTGICTINRTIVELKSVFDDFACCAIVYQSYHRGIEISCTFHEAYWTQLSIVPSWNWNYIHNQGQSARQSLSIVPSWN